MPAARDWGSGHREGAKDAAPARPGGPWAEVRWETAAAITAGYLASVFLGVRAMASRPAVQKRVFEYMFVYNLAQVLLNASLSYNLFREAWTLGFPYPWGNALDASEKGHRLL